MGATMSNNNKNCSVDHGPHLVEDQDHHVSADSSGNYIITTAAGAGFGQNLASREGMENGFFFPFGNSSNKAANLSVTEEGSGAGGACAGAGAPSSSSLLQDMISMSSASGFAGSSFDDTFGGMLSAKKDGGGGNEGMTRDFLGLRPLSESDILSIAGLSSHVNNQNQNQKSWHGN